MAKDQNLEDRVEAIINLASSGRLEALGADGLNPSAALLAIENPRQLDHDDEWTTRLPGEQYVKWAPITPDEDEPEPEHSQSARNTPEGNDAVASLRQPTPSNKAVRKRGRVRHHHDGLAGRLVRSDMPPQHSAPRSAEHFCDEE